MLSAFLHSLLSQHHPEEEQAAEAETGTPMAMTLPLARASRRIPRRVPGVTKMQTWASQYSGSLQCEHHDQLLLAFAMYPVPSLAIQKHWSLCHQQLQAQAVQGKG